MRLNVNICCWWLYMLCEYMLLVIIYVVCIYVVGDYICCVHICWWWLYMLCAYVLLVKSFTCYWWWIVGVRMYWNIFGVDLWNYMKYVLLLSSPSSHTVGLVDFISMLVLNTYVFIIRCFYSGWYDVFFVSGATASEMKGNRYHT